MMALRFTILVAIASCASSMRSEQVHHSSLGHEEIASVPMHLYRKDCWQKRAVVKAAKQQTLANALRGAGYALDQAQNPGAGLGKIVPFETVQKDGFYEVECVSDKMFTYGDKFGDNRHSYNLGESANVSIVLYETVVPKEDREPMTHAVCFAFCRTVPDMHFFGILNGRNCYCTPYYQREASDSSSCDATCEGNPSLMCGGKSKSSVFGMHMCADTASDVKDAQASMTDISADLEKVAGSVDATKKSMQKMAEGFQASFGKVGDPAAGALMQSAKVYAGVLEKAANAGKDTVKNAGDLKGKAAGLQGADFSKVEDVKKAEDLVSQMQSVTSEGSEQVNELGKLLAQSNPAEADPDADSKDLAKEFYNFMYFVDKDHKDTMSTCAGDAVEKPLVGSKDECAMACINDVHDCVGFNYFEGEDSGLCFLLSSFKTATYYTKCKDQKEAVCMAKFSSFEGTTLKPDGSGKCKECFKEVTKADRCY